MDLKEARLLRQEANRDESAGAPMLWTRPLILWCQTCKTLSQHTKCEHYDTTFLVCWNCDEVRGAEL